ncbi:Lytic transglycosylase catalytic [Shewanella halifaxensis HAW-EB4]|uniref:Lytic transglycosylase catalytic n=1 Tax=Shewanella halifaxensis (strain HAW-EB4) TaxID=458817 RepID=B0TMJ9_SHEHH|nr:transglycosylase SLT domain-containing protein [Shewanella halifaxensis]ABZ77359.1 Lytic transglycosylase catalytic [Shewanella halifaxensis HAW-EB4]
MNYYYKSLIAFSITSIVFSANANTESSFSELEQAKTRINQPFEEKVADFHQYVNQYLDEYEAWRSQYNEALDKQRTELIGQWGSGEVSDQTKSVEYTDNNTVKKVIDYENNTATISVLLDADAVTESTPTIVQQGLTVDGQILNLTQASVSLVQVNYSLQQEKQEKSFIIKQIELQMKELDIQADRLIQSATGIPESFIFERAHKQKQILLAEGKVRLKHITDLYDSKREELGIETVALLPMVSDSKPTTALQTEQTQVSDKQTTKQAELRNNATDKPTVTLATEQAPVVNKQTTSQVERHDKASQAVAEIVVPAAVIKPAAQKKIVSYTVKLPNKSLNLRANQYHPLATAESKKWGIDEAVIMAIMHSESSFRPDAKSHVPAFGLMQVVPVSAGHDVNKHIRNIDAPMRAEELYVPPLNVETGVAYLHILNDKYLKAITDPQSRLYCMIAAYNTGAGNVARAFNENRTTNIRKAAEVINKMPPDQVYQHLLKQLPYDETKNYLKKVNQRIALYQ